MVPSMSALATALRNISVEEEMKRGGWLLFQNVSGNSQWSATIAPEFV